MNLNFIKSITWDEVFSSWEKSEANLPHWIAHYKKRGFDSWKEWRKDSIKNLHPEQLKWELYEITDPLSAIPEFYGGPFRSWKKKYYGDKEILQFKELAKKPELQNDIRINEIIKKFPKESTLIGIRKDKNVIIVEGMHRSCALAVAKEKGITINTKLFIVLTEFHGDMPILGQENSPT